MRPYVFGVLLLACFASSTAGSAQAQPAPFVGRVVGVTDGDTIRVLRDGRLETVRLDGIDCPELGQAFGRRAKTATAEFVLDRTVRVEPKSVDRYGRTVARVRLEEGVDLSVLLVRSGWAWHFLRYSTDPALAEAEREAREASRGLWTDPHAVAPWDYRAGRTTAAPEHPAVASGPYHGNVRSLVLHGPGCPDYRCPNCTAVFSSLTEALAAGYRVHLACIRAKEGRP